MSLGSSTIPQRARLNWWPGSTLTHQSKRSSRQCSFLEKWWLPIFFVVCGLLMVDLTPLSSIINAAAYQETLKRLKEANWQKRSGSWPKEFLFCNTVLYLTVLLQPWIFWTHEGERFFPHPPSSPDLLCRTSVCSQRWKSTSEVSASTPLNMFKMKSRTGYVPSTHFCVWRTWQIDMSLWYVSR